MLIKFGHRNTVPELIKLAHRNGIKHTGMPDYTFPALKFFMGGIYALN